MSIRRDSAEAKNDSSGVNGKRQGGAPTAADRRSLMTLTCPTGVSGILYNHGEFIHTNMTGTLMK